MINCRNNYAFTLLIFLEVALMLLATAAPNRKLKTSLNPGCKLEECTQKKNSSSLNLIYTKSDGPNDTLHYLWSTIGAPTVIIAQTTPSAELYINWPALIDEANVAGSINFTEKPFYTFGVVLTNLIEFDDQKDTGVYSTSDVNSTFPAKNLVWDAVEDDMFSSLTHSKAVFSTLNDSSTLLYNKKGKIQLQMDVYGEENHDEALPRLLFNSNSSQIRIFLDNLLVNFKNSRFGLELLAISSEPGESHSYHYSTFDTINDEYTPGVFKSVQLSSTASQKESFGSFFSWKPVAYTSKDLVVVESSDVHLSNITYNSGSKDIPYSIAQALFGTEDDQYLYGTFVISIGTEKDGFYAKSNYNVWTVIAGVGKPIQESFSFLVIMILASGIGIPFVLMLGSTVYIMMHKLRNKNETPNVRREPLNVDS